MIVFNLEQQKELLREEDFTLAALPMVARALDAVQPATVDYRTLQNPSRAGDFVQDLVKRELQASKPSDAVVSLGPRSIDKSKPSPALVLPPGAKQRFFYLLWEQPPVWAGASFVRNPQGEFVPRFGAVRL